MIELLEAAYDEVERVESQIMEHNMGFTYQTIGSALSPFRVDRKNLSDFNETPSESNE